MKKSICVILCILILAGTLAGFGGCVNKPSDETDTSEINTTQTMQEGDSDTYIPPDVNYGGRDFNIMTWSGSEDWVLEFETGLSTIDAQTYYHLMNVEKELGVKFKIAIEEKGDYANMGSFITKVLTLSGSDGIDLICQYSLAASLGAQQSLYKNLRELDYINWDAEYWSSSLTEANTINGKMFYCSGDLTGSVVKNMFLLTFNKEMASNYKMGNLYDVVRSGEWTIEKLYTLSSTVYSDNNGNTRKDKEDTFGLVVGEYNTIEAFQYGANMSCLQVNGYGELEINPDLYSERGHNVVEKLKKLMHDNVGAYCHTKSEGFPMFNNAMETGKAVFYPMIAGTIINSLSTTTIDYGILPMPKYDVDQKDYHTTLGMVYSMFSVPNVASDPNMSAAVLESMAHDGYVNLNPVIYDALKYRYSNGSDDVEMFEILRDGIIFDSGRIIEFIDIFALVRRTVRDNDNLASYYKAQQSVFENGVKEANFMFS